MARPAQDIAPFLCSEDSITPTVDMPVYHPPESLMVVLSWTRPQVYTCEDFLVRDGLEDNLLTKFC